MSWHFSNKSWLEKISRAKEAKHKNKKENTLHAQRNGNINNIMTTQGEINKAKDMTKHFKWRSLCCCYCYLLTSAIPMSHEVKCKFYIKRFIAWKESRDGWWCYALPEHLWPIGSSVTVMARTRGVHPARFRQDTSSRSKFT